ncbi:hypothetical protein [Sphingomonas nostoxanthinifaciens]|uniref:hypothetical protein n=1 Tax=Sphingomonas nostoxanthinifaciens TaxID=2872652 RepID=UPI001CC20EE2|nr:hypothetical protein [Sphingomonas nostoxanthinifaciens]UAK25678.1 hypothetical protein K8P63_05935 [Sphingomonas nostoxanthinifaciens]
MIAYKDKDRMVITEMREPAGEMIRSYDDIPAAQQDIWRRSIDAALDEKDK